MRLYVHIRSSPAFLWVISSLMSCLHISCARWENSWLTFQVGERGRQEERHVEVASYLSTVKRRLAIQRVDRLCACDYSLLLHQRFTSSRSVQVSDSGPSKQARISCARPTPFSIPRCSLLPPHSPCVSLKDHLYFGCLDEIIVRSQAELNGKWWV